MKKSKKTPKAAKKAAAQKRPARRESARKEPLRQDSNKTLPMWRQALPWLPCVLLLLLPALTFSSGARETFRLPKLLMSEILALVTWLFLATRLWKVKTIDWRALLRHPAVHVIGPLLLVASLSWWTSEHRHHVEQGLVSLWIGGLSVVFWSLGWRGRELARTLQLLVIPGVLLAVLGLLQVYGVVELFQFRDALQDRIAMTSLAGGAFDLAAYLVLPALVAQLACKQTDVLWQRVAWMLVLALFVYVIAVTRTLSAIAGLLVASAVLWFQLLPKRQLWRLGLALGSALLAAMLLLAPLRLRVIQKVNQLEKGRYNQVLNGRLDGWNTALWMLQKEPLLGVGHGAYRAEFGHAKLDLRQSGVLFFRMQHQPYFVNAHNEPLEAAAEWGGLGIFAMAGAAFALWRRLRQRGRQLAALEDEGLRRARGGELALMWSGLVALGLMSMTYFPLRIALVAYPFLLFVAWILRTETPLKTPEEAAA